MKGLLERFKSSLPGRLAAADGQSKARPGRAAATVQRPAGKAKRAPLTVLAAVIGLAALARRRQA